MKVGIITQYCCSSNYGGLLQAYALVKMVKKLGYDVEQVCYNYYNSQNTKNTRFRLFHAIFHKKILQKFLFLLYHTLFDGMFVSFFNVTQKIQVRKDSCVDFRENYISHSLNVYNDDTIKICNDYDILIAGSDQIWNCNFKKYHPGFWLDVQKKNVKKISYAASISMNGIPKEYCSYVQRNLETFDAISVREKSDVLLIKQIIGNDKDVSWVLDPTFLLSRNDWNLICSKNKYSNQPYLFAYLLGDKIADRKFVTRLAKAKGLQIITIPYLLNKYRSCDNRFGDVQLSDVSPQMFLSLIRDASCVVTDSFHGTVFSNIFHTDYYVLKRNADSSVKSMNSRVYSLLDLFGTEHRMIDNMSKIDDVCKISSIDFEKVDSVINREKEKSLYFLKSSLES